MYISGRDGNYCPILATYQKYIKTDQFKKCTHVIVVCGQWKFVKNKGR